MRTIDPPPDLIPVPLAKGCVLLLTEREYVAGIRRGKWWRRRQAMARRDQATSERPDEECPDDARKTFLDSESERAAASAPGRDVVGSPVRCPVCGGAMPERRTFACSDKCRAAKSRRERLEEQAEKSRHVRELLEAAMRVVGGQNGPE